MKLNTITALSLLLCTFQFLSCSGAIANEEKKSKEERVDVEGEIADSTTEFKQYQSTLAAKEEGSLFIVPNHNAKQQYTNRWYELNQIEKGKILYKKSCIACHLENAKGTKDWQESLDDGGYPPPPLNGSAHTWHHPLGQLHEVIKYGLIEYGTTMPAWGGIYNDEQILDLIASFQSYWDDETYHEWMKRH